MSKYREFKVGDRVRFKDGHSWASTTLTEFTIETLVGDVFTIKEDYSTSRLEHIELVVDERQALSDAIALVQKYKIGVNVANDRVWSYRVFGHSNNRTVVELLDKLFPPAKTADQLEIEEVEGKLRVLADQLAKLKER